MGVWTCALGSKLIYNKRVSQPLAFGVGSSMPMIAFIVHKCAVEHPDEDVEQSAEAGGVRTFTTCPIKCSCFYRNCNG